MEGDAPAGSSTQEDVATRVAAFQGDLLARLQVRRRAISLRRVHDAELARLWGRANEELGEIYRQLRSGDRPTGAVEQLRVLLDAAPKPAERWTLEFAREFSHSLRALLPLFGDAAYLRAALGTKDAQERLAAVLPAARLRALEAALGSDEPVDGARVAQELRIARLHRANRRRRTYARQAVREGLLLKTLAVLVPPAAAAGLVLAFADDETVWRVALAATAGALASVLAGFYVLRDDLRRLTDLRAFDATLYLQPFVGAAVGLLAFLLVDVGILHLPPADSEPTLAAYGLYGFLLGFSEPFLLRTVGRLTRDAGREERRPDGEEAAASRGS